MAQFCKGFGICVLILGCICALVLGSFYLLGDYTHASYNVGLAIGGVLSSIALFCVLYAVGQHLENQERIIELLKLRTSGSASHEGKPTQTQISAMVADAQYDDGCTTVILQLDDGTMKKIKCNGDETQRFAVGTHGVLTYKNGAIDDWKPSKNI